MPLDLDVHLIVDNYATHNGADPELVSQAAAVPPALHSHQRVLAEPGGAVVRAADRKSCGAACIRAAENWKLPSTGFWMLPTKTPRIWTKTADQILANVARFCQRTLDT